MSTNATFYVDVGPSVNAAFRNVAGKGRVKTTAYNSWIDGALRALISQRAKKIVPPVSVTIELPMVTLGDLDSRCKTALDLLVRAGIIQDDSKRYVRSISMSFYDGKQMRITVQSLNGDAT